jgi:exopolyphosphatase/guanosine-5'-triphosphate,3'-diphosphate pyrophosphatase
MSPREPRRVAVIDLGSNTARMVIMSAVPGYAFRLEDEIREVVRLRQGMTERGLGEEAAARALSTLRLFKRFCESTGADLILPTATSAVRDAANGRAFLDRVHQDLGLQLRILDGEREAYYGTVGALNEVGSVDGAVLDIGGGSAQLSQVRSGRYVRGDSRTLGSLALTERFVHTDPPGDRELDAVRAEVADQLSSIPWLDEVDGRQLVGLGGTIRNLAKIDSARRESPLNTLHGYVLSRKSVDRSLRLFRESALDRRQKIPGLSADRADIILAGALVVQGVLDRLGADELTISTSGLREGVFYEYFWQHLDYPVIPDVRRFGVLNVARNYGYQKQHANHVRYLAGRMFEQLAPLHGYGAAERELLDAAALLHDLGTVIAYDGHHKHSQTLIHYNGLSGYSPREIALIALLARYHRKGTPSCEGYGAILDGDDEVRLRRLAAILRLAEFLERGRNAAVDDVIVSWGDDFLRLTLVADEHPAVELWETERNALPLVEAAFGRPVQLDTIAEPPGEA